MIVICRSTPNFNPSLLVDLQELIPKNSTEVKNTLKDCEKIDEFRKQSESVIAKVLVNCAREAKMIRSYEFPRQGTLSHSGSTRQLKKIFHRFRRLDTDGLDLEHTS